MALIINGERVEDDELERVQGQLVQQASSSGQPEWEAKGIGLDAFTKQMVSAQVLIRQEARKRSGSVPNKEIDRELNRLRQEHGGEKPFREHLRASGLTEEEIRENIETGLNVDRLLDKACADLPEPTEEELRAHYEANAQAFGLPERIRVSHIVKNVQGTVLDVQAAHTDLKPVLRQLQQGADFEMLARRSSDCADNGGDLGWFSRGAMVPEFEEVVFALEVGETSGIFRTPYGLHIARLHDRAPAEVRPFDDVVDEVRETLRTERENAAIDAYTDTLREQATVEEE